jgi:hypothetical protein
LLAVDEHGRIPGVADVFAADDATPFRLKQGGSPPNRPTPRPRRSPPTRRCRRADAVSAGTAGLPLTGGAPLYLRAALSPIGQPEDSSARRTTGSGVVSGARSSGAPGAAAGALAAASGDFGEQRRTRRART